MPAILDVAIGVIFVFLLFSLVVSAANEIWLSFLDKRAEFLKEGLQELLRDSVNSPDVIKADHILQHGLISALSRGKFDSTANNTDGVPSYIPGKSFVLALLSEVQKKSAAAGVADADLRRGLEKLGNKELKETLLALHDDARGNLDHFKANIENWFNESMDRVSGWYTRYAKQWLLGIGLVLALVGNVDTIHIAQVLAEPKNEALRTAIVTQATNYAKNANTKANDVASGADAPVTSERIQHFKNALAELQGTGLPVGWDSQQLSYLSAHWFTAIAGWILTALAASLGAPFWFDTLNRFIDIRSNGRAPEESDPTAPKKQSTGVESYVVTGDSLKSKGTPATAAEQTGVAQQQPPAPAPDPPPVEQVARAAQVPKAGEASGAMQLPAQRRRSR